MSINTHVIPAQAGIAGLVDAAVEFLPDTGRGTMQGMVEGQVRLGALLRGTVVGVVPLHHPLRGRSPSPCRGGIAR
jgi:hypothetical protein